MADSPERIAAGLRYLQEKAPADPLGSFRSVAAFKDAYQPVLNNARQFFATGAGLGELLRAYAAGAAPAQAAVAKGMGIPYGGPMTAPREEGVTSDENFRPMGNAKQQLAGQMLGDPTNLLPMVGPAARGVVAAGKAAAPRIARGLEQHMVNTGGMLPMDVWHGSPHRFSPTAKNPLGELDASKIGTGEGAQAYGHGLYLAEAKGTAKYYADNLAKIEEGMTLQVTNPTRGKGIANDFHKFVHETYLDAAANIEKGAKLDPIAFKNDVFTLFDDFGKYPLTSEQKENLWKQMIANGAIKKANKVSSNIYKVDLPDEQIAKMLDWDKPLSDQAPEVQAALEKIGIRNTPEILAEAKLQREAAFTRWHTMNRQLGSDHTDVKAAYKDFKAFQVDEDKVKSIAANMGSDIYKNIGESDQHATKLLRDAGITGIRYLDGGSRAGGAGTSNFVVFDPAHMNILERNGVTAASLRKVAPQDEALRLAQQRAALPVKQGGLGLPANNTPEQRAAAMKFDTPAYHGTHSDVSVFDRRKNVTAKDIYSSPNPAESSSYAENLGGLGGNVMPLLLRGGVKDLTQESPYVANQLRKAYNAQVSTSERKYYPFEQFQNSFMGGQLYQDSGGQSAQNALVGELIGNKNPILKIPDAVSGGGVGESYVVANPDNIRSRFAAFDPFRRNAALAAALGVAAPDLLAKEKVKK